MDKLDAHLDQICRGIAGPGSLRKHLRQELREHLTDAIQGHVAAGISEEQAFQKAIEDFGGAETVRQGLASVYGRRPISLVIEKAMEWKEKTMRAQWLWSSWIYLGMLLVITLEVLFVAGLVVAIWPRVARERPPPSVS